MLRFPKHATDCLKTITSFGYEAFFVGGCVRDALLERDFYDIDIATNALPQEIEAIFPKTVPTGIKHGTVTVLFDGHAIEVTTYRTESEYKDLRHPDSVNFVSSLSDDLARRDFTINALACCENGEITDIFGGLNDLKNGVIRAVGDPEKRFGEDALRIVRAYRFASVLGFEIEEKTRISAQKLAHNLYNLSGERVLKELVKTSAGSRPSAICELILTGALKHFGIESILFNPPTFDRIATLNIDELSKVSLLISLCKHNVDALKSSLKLSNAIADNISFLNALISDEKPKDKRDVKMLLYKYGLTKTSLYLNYIFITENLNNLKLFNVLDGIISNGEAYKISHLEVDGNDLKNLGVEGIKIGQTLDKILRLVIEEKLENRKEKLLQFLKN